jgi:hypothetical protein
MYIQRFCGHHRDADAGLRDIPQPSYGRDDEDGGTPCPEDDEYFEARPDAAETEEAISKFISGLESQEQAGFDRLHSLLSRLPVPVATTGSKMSHAAALEGDEWKATPSRHRCPSRGSVETVGRPLCDCRV